MAMKRIKISDLTPDARNANKGTERGSKALEKSLRDYGAGRSILVDKDGNVIAGNKTLEEAGQIGIDDVIIVETDGRQLVAVKRTDLSIDSPQGRGLAIADNRTGQLNLDWDADVLKALQDEGLDLSAYWREDELADLLGQEETPPPPPPPQTTRAAELQKKWQVQRGDVWAIGKHRLMCGDSTSADDVGRLMGGEKADLVVTDPPYGVAYADKNEMLNAVGRGNRIQEPIANDHLDDNALQTMWKGAFTNAHAAMSAGAAFYCFMPQGGDQMMMMMMMTQSGLVPRHELIWLKNNHVLGRTDYAYIHEPIIYAWKAGGHKFYGEFQTSVLQFDRPQKSDMHPTMKPVSLIAKLITNSSLPHQTVIDPFGGSGTTMIACQQTNRVCRMMELSPEYCAVILERMADMGVMGVKA